MPGQTVGVGEGLLETLPVVGVVFRSAPAHVREAPVGKALRLALALRAKRPPVIVARWLAARGLGGSGPFAVAFVAVVDRLGDQSKRDHTGQYARDLLRIGAGGGGGRGGDHAGGEDREEDGFHVGGSFGCGVTR